MAFKGPQERATPMDRAAHGSFNSVDTRLSTPNTPLLGDSSFLRPCSEAEAEAGGLDVVGPLSEQDMLQVEALHCQELAQDLRERHPQEPNLRQEPIGLALSGGGTRAAAFHCGVLWTLADAGILKDVMHLSATSGGGYTAAALMSHLYQMSSDAEHTKVLDDWYRQVVMRMCLRMQHNINYLVDITPSRLFRMPQHDDPNEEGSGLGPRIFDLPLLIGALLCSVVASPVMLVVHTVWPIVLHIELYHGSRLRGVWCNPERAPWSNEALQAWLWDSLWAAGFWAAAWVALNLLAGLGFCQPRRQKPMRYLTFRSLRHVVLRGTVLYLVYLGLVVAILWLQMRDFGSAFDEGPRHPSYVRAACRHYVVDAVGAVGPLCSDRSWTAWSSTQGTWYESSASALYLNETWASRHVVPPAGSAWRHIPPAVFGQVHHKMLWHAAMTSLGISGLIAAGVLILLMGSVLLKWLLTIAIPLGYLFIVASVTRWKIFGPITGQELMPLGESWGYSPEMARDIFGVCIFGAFLTLPVYDALLKLSHLYYRRALKRAFFHGGKDVSDGALLAIPYCPNFLLGACLHDYRPLGEVNNFCDFSISSLFLGSRRTGFFYTPSQARLAHLMTVAGAATDASLLISLDILLIRFVLGVLSLRFGDFLRLEPEGETAVRVSQKIRSGFVRAGKVVKSIFPKGRAKMKRLKRYISEDHDQHFLQRWMQGLLDRIPAAFPFFVCQALLLFSALFNGARSPDGSCRLHDIALGAAFGLLYAVLALSFFAYFKPLQCLMRSPMVQQVQMMAMHIYVAPNPPPYIYVSDGGLLEVLGLLPLLRRRLRRIVVSDAAHDPTLTMRCLREAAEIARKERLCSFFDPSDPRRDLEFMLQDLPRSNAACLHLGIRYEPQHSGEGPGEVHEVEVGEIFYVRMRLPPGDREPVRSLLTAEELLGPPRPARSTPEPGAGQRRSLGGTCKPWCECGGFCAGRQFPHYNMGNQFLTPLHFANLCGLGAELSQPLVDDIRESLAQSRHVRATAAATAAVA